MIRRSLLFILLIPLNYAVVAQDEGQEPITEVIILESTPLWRLRREISVAQDKIHALFNELNTEDEFDIVCYVEAKVGTRMKKKVCAPNYYHAATREEAAAYLIDMDPESPVTIIPTPISAVLSRKNPILRAKMTKLANENPELMSAIDERYELLLTLEERVNPEDSEE